jgi:non-specific serine/threonine protein kinase
MNALSDDLILTPAGHLRLQRGQGDGIERPGAWMRKVADAFSSCQASGLFALAVSNPDTPLSPSLSYWRDLACRYLTHLCRTPESAGGPIDPIDPPDPAEIASLQYAAPPMQGGEYLNTGLLHNLWIDLDAWVRNEIASSGMALSVWLKKYAPIWQQVGRVCFHLAENKSDPEFPFAFLATYAPRLSRGGQVQYQPLGKALQEYAGQKNKKALISLLSPVQAASEKSQSIKELIDSGDVFHPLAWSPKHASGTSLSWRRAAFWCGFRTGGKSVPDLAWLSPWAKKSKAG